MKHEVQLSLNKEYFSEAFDQSLRYSKWWRKVERVLGVLFIIVGIAIILWSNEPMATPIVLLIFGLYELFNPILKKPWWVNRQMKSKAANGQVSLIFTESGIESAGPYSQGSMSWDGVERILETPKGVLIWPQKGIQIYLPNSKVQSEVIDYVLSKSV